MHTDPFLPCGERGFCISPDILRSFPERGVRTIFKLSIFTVACLVLSLAFADAAAGLNFFAERYDEFPNDDAAQKALGGPRGEGEWGGNSLDVCTLGNGGSIELGFEGARYIFDGPGPDFIVFENAFQTLDTQPPNDPTGLYFAELMFVEVSTDGEVFARFPAFTTNTEPVHAGLDGLDAAQYSGFAGVHPVYANVDTNAIDPFDPSAAGGDAFDLANLATHPLVLSGAVDLNRINRVRLVDIIGDGSVPDDAGNPIYDVYRYAGDPLVINGADVDALAVINGAAVPEPGSLSLLLTVLPALVAVSHYVRKGSQQKQEVFQ